MSDPRHARPTIYDVAKRAGVSKSLVSLVLNGSDQVSEAKRGAVNRAIVELGYRRSRSAASLARSRTHTVGLVVDDFENPWFVPLLRGLREELSPHGLYVAIREQRASTASGGNAIEEFLDSEVDALVVAAEPGREFGHLGIPTVIEGTRLHAIEGADLVDSDQHEGTLLAVEHLVALGHRKIGHLSGQGGAAATRLDGYRSAMLANGLQPAASGSEYETNDDGGYQGTRQILVDHPDLTALVAANDMMAVGARAALDEAGLAIPTDISVVGYDNSVSARTHLLDMTTIDPCHQQVGRTAGRALLRRLSSPDATPLRVAVNPRLVQRSSSAAPAPKGSICTDKLRGER